MVTAVCREMYKSPPGMRTPPLIWTPLTTWRSYSVAWYLYVCELS